MSNTEIVEYGVTDAAIAELKAKFSLVPDSSTDEGYADIKSALKIITPYRTKVEAKRKELKADSLARGRLIDTEAKRIMDAVAGIEEPFKLAKKEQDDVIAAQKQAVIDQAAKDLAELEAKLSHIKGLADGLLGSDSGVIQVRIDAANKIDVNETEYKHLFNESVELMGDAMFTLNAALVDRKAYEAQQEEQVQRKKEMDDKQAELDAKQAVIEAKEADQKQKEREEAIAKDAADKAVKDAEKAAQLEKDAADKRESDLKAEAEKLKQDAIDTEARIKREAEAEKQLEIDEAKKREANKKHKAKVNNEAVKALVEGGMNETNAKKAVTLIAKRLIPNVVISY